MMDQKKQAKNRSIDPNNLFQTHLSIQISLDGFSFCILDKSYDLVQKLEYIPYPSPAKTPEDLLVKVRAVFDKEKLLNHRYGSMNVTHVNELCTLVPKALFDEGKLKEYIRYSSKTFDNDYIVYDSIDSHNLVNVYIPFVNVNNFLLDRFGSFEYSHFSTVFLSNLLDTYKMSEHPHVFVHLEPGRMYTAVISEGKLQLCNSYSIKTKEDFLYYVLFISEQLRLSPESLELVLSGSISKKDEIFDLALAYIRKVSLLENRFKHSFQSSIGEDKKRRHLTLINQY